MKKMLILVLLSASCGGTFWVEECPGDWFFEAGGLIVCSEGELDPAEVEYAVQITEAETAVRYPEVSNLKDTLKNNEVAAYFVDDDLALDCEKLDENIYRCGDTIGGANYNGEELYIRYHPCLALTALGHELLHSVERYYLDTFFTSDHTTPWLFYQSSPNQVEAVEHKIFQDLFANLASCEELRNRQLEQ